MAIVFRFASRWQRTTFLICFVFICAGCGGPTDKVQVEGTVSWNDQPVPQGHITFFSAPSVPAGGGAIESGHFRFLSKVGVMSVQITASREGKYDPGEKSIAREQYIPAQYNQKTTLQADVTREGKNQFTFALTEGSN